MCAMPLAPPVSAASKLAHVGESVFARMSALAQACGAINLAQGFADFDPPAALIESLSQAIKVSGHHQYAPSAGVPALREAIAQQVRQGSGVCPDPQAEVTVTVGATQALWTAITTWVQRDDEVIVFTPCYDSYLAAIEAQGARAICVDLGADVGADSGVDWAQVAACVNARTRMVIVNTPHNPTGAVWSAQDWQELAKVLERSSAVVLSDEVYEHLCFDEREHVSAWSVDALRPRCVVVNSFGKSLHVTGWKLGYCVASAPLMAAFRRVHQFVVFSVHTPTQQAMAAYVQQHQEFGQQARLLYQGKRDIVRQTLAGSRFELLPCQGSFFQCVGFRRISQDSDEAFAQWLAREHGVASIPLSAFYPDGRDRGIIRLCFAKSAPVLGEALQRLLAV